MGERAFENRIKKLKELEEQKKGIEDQIDKIKAEVKADMQAKGKDEIEAGNFIVRLKEVISSRFDTKSFAKDHKSLYEAYTRSQSTLRFTIV